MACTSSTINFSKYLSNVKFNLSQVRNFYSYFKKFLGNSNSEKMNLVEFRNSLGIIGNNCGEFICQRLFNLIKDPLEISITFENYLKFLNLVNNGTVEEKLKHSFKFMDLENKGFIDKENFKKTSVALCDFFEKVSQTQSKLKEEDIDFIFKEILSKTERTILDYREYIQLISNYPEIFDFFDIFNNKLFESSMIVLNRENFSRLKNISEKFKKLLYKVETINLKYSDVTLGLTKFIHKADKTEKKLEKLRKINTIRENKLKNYYNESLVAKKIIPQNESYVKKVQENFSGKSPINDIFHYNSYNHINSYSIKPNIKQSLENFPNILENTKKRKIFFLSEKIYDKDETFDDDEIEISDVTDEKELLNNLSDDLSEEDIVNDESMSENIFSNFFKYQGQVSKDNKTSPVKRDHANSTNIKSVTASTSAKPAYYRSHSANVKVGPTNESNRKLRPRYINSEEKSNYSNGINEKESSFVTNEKIYEFKNNNYSFMQKEGHKHTHGHENKHEHELFSNQYLDFDLFTPAPLMHEELSNKFKENNLDPENCLIITNKKNFIKWIGEISDALKNVLNEIDPNKKMIRRRPAISKKINRLNSFEKEDYLNPCLSKVDEEGLIHFGNPNVELVLNMMIGIRNSVNTMGEPRKLFNITVKDEAFKELNSFKFSQNTFEKEITCTFYDYAPKVFSNLRKIYGISNQNYLKSLGPENFLGNLILCKNRSLRELCSSGKSGSFFYYSYDSKFVLKTISLTEFQFFQNILDSYYFYMLNNKDTLLQRFYGLHTIVHNNEKRYIVIMNNVFHTNIKINYKYDLKGSLHQRISRTTPENNYDSYNYAIPLKDLDFIDREEAVCISDEDKEILIKQLKMDADFLASKTINDYSLLIGVHNEEFFNEGTNYGSEKNMLYDFLKVNTACLDYFNPMEKNNEKVDRKPFYQSNNGGLMSRDGKKIYFLGVIDIFTQYGAKKKFEYFFKSVTQGDGISCKPPEEYSERFKSFISDIFK